MSLLWISWFFEGWISSLLQDFNLIWQEKTDESNRRAGCSGSEGRNPAQPLPYFHLEWPCKARRGNKAVFGMLIFGYRVRKWACSSWSVVEWLNTRANHNSLTLQNTWCGVHPPIFPSCICCQAPKAKWFADLCHQATRFYSDHPGTEERTEPSSRPVLSSDLDIRIWREPDHGNVRLQES